MLAKNEAKNLPTCLASVQTLSAELIIVDTGSTDETVGIGAEHGAQVIHCAFNPVNFGAARNLALEQAKGGWILVLDADETIDPTSLPAIAAILGTSGDTGYFLERHNHASDCGTATIDHVVRLFPNRRQHRYKGRVHETIDDSILAGGGRLVPSAIRINHNFVSDRETRRRKNHWYIEILKEEMAANPNDDTRLDFLAAEYHQLEMFDEATAIAERIVQLRPDDARAHLFAGTYHLLFRPNFKQARLDFNQALKLRPGYSEAESFLRLLDSTEAGTETGGSQSSILLPSQS